MGADSDAVEQPFRERGQLVVADINILQSGVLPEDIGRDARQCAGLQRGSRSSAVEPNPNPAVQQHTQTMAKPHRDTCIRVYLHLEDLQVGVALEQVGVDGVDLVVIVQIQLLEVRQRLEGVAWHVLLPVSCKRREKRGQQPTALCTTVVHRYGKPVSSVQLNILEAGADRGLYWGLLKL